MDKGKKSDAVYLADMGRKTRFGLNKILRVIGKPMAGLDASATLDKKANLDANCLLNGKKGLFPKLEKRSRGVWGFSGRGSISIPTLGKKNGYADKLGVGKGY